MSGRGFTPLVVSVAVALLVGGGLYLTGVLAPEEEPGELGPAIPEPALKGADQQSGSTGEAEGTEDPDPIKTVPFNPEEEAVHEALPGARGEDGPDVTGIVVDARGRPVKGARVALFVDQSPVKTAARPAASPAARLVTGTTGRFGFRGLSLQNRYVIRAAHDDYAAAWQKGVMPADPKTLGPFKLRLLDGRSVSGRVTSTSGAPLQGATVYVYNQTIQSMDPEGNLERSVQSRADGTYEVEHLSKGNKRIIVRLDGYAADGRSIVDLNRNERVEDLDFVLGEGHRITGRVVDRDTGAPVGGATVNARPLRYLKGPGQPALGLKNDPGARAAGHDMQRALHRASRKHFLGESAVADEHGRFEIRHLLNASYRLQVTAEGYQPNFNTQVNAGTRDVTLRVVRSPSVSGRVVDDETGEPVTEFAVAVMARKDVAFLPPQLKKHYEDPEGRFTYTGVRPGGNQYVIVEATGYAVGRQGPIALTGSQQVEQVEVRMVRGATARGRVVDSEGQGIGGAMVSVVFAPAGGGDVDPQARVFLEMLKQNLHQGTRQARTAGDGSWTLPNLLAGTYTFKVEHPQYSTAESEEIPVGNSGEVNVPDIVMQQGGIIRGLVLTESDQPDPDAAVQVRSADNPMAFARPYHTDSEGRFEATGLKPGAYRVRVTQRKGQVDLVNLLLNRDSPQGKLVTVREGQVVEVEL